MIRIRLLAGFVGAIYAALTIATYAQLSLTWEYIGFWYRPPSAWETAATVGFAGLLGLVLPVSEWTTTTFVKWILYFVLIVPSLVVPPQQGALSREALFLLFLLLFMSSALFFAFLKDGRPFVGMFLQPRIFTLGVIAVWGLGNLTIIYVFWGQMNFVGLDDVYSQRNAAATVSSSAIAYVMGLMSGAINPYLLVTGLLNKRPLPVAMAIMGQVIIYSTLAGKIVLGSTLLTVGVFFAFKHGRVLFTRVFSAILSFGALGPIISVPAALGSLQATISVLVYMRILVLPGVLVGVYSEFFTHYPVTYLSHSIIGRPFSDYPYGSASVGQVVGYYVTPVAGDEVNNYVANFIAGDGIAGFGVWGIPIIFLITAIWFWIVSKFIGKQEQQFTCAMLMSYVVSLANASLFTTILTGGGAALAMLMYLHRSAEETERKRLGRDTPPPPSAPLPTTGLANRRAP